MNLSIIIPTIGRPSLTKVLDRIIDCNEFKTIKPEILVIYDGQANKKIDQNKGLIKLFKTGNKKGVSSARNLGLHKTTGDIITFIGDDTIPTKNWLQKIFKFHSTHPDPNTTLLGKISWIPELAKDPFHQWLENNAQFSFNAIKKHGPTWHHFYTSNISLKRELIGNERFSEKFTGWGFEDTEFGYRLTKKGMQMVYDENCEVLHDHKQTLESVIKNTRNSRTNAKTFETLHPEIKILPEHRSKCFIKISVILKVMIWMSAIVTPFSQKTQWWREWKKRWIE